MSPSRRWVDEVPSIFLARQRSSSFEQRDAQGIWSRSLVDVPYHQLLLRQLLLLHPPHHHFLAVRPLVVIWIFSSLDKEFFSCRVSMPCRSQEIAFVGAPVSHLCSMEHGCNNLLLRKQPIIFAAILYPNTQMRLHELMNHQRHQWIPRYSEHPAMHPDLLQRFCNVRLEILTM